MYAYIWCKDPTLILLSQKPNKEAVVANWTEGSAKSKSNIILCLGDAVFAKNPETVDDNFKSAIKKLWDKLKRISTTLSQQKISYLQNRLIRIIFGKDKSRDVHVSSYMRIIGKLGTFDQTFIKEKTRQASLLTSDIIRTAGNYLKHDQQDYWSTGQLG